MTIPTSAGLTPAEARALAAANELAPGGGLLKVRSLAAKLDVNVSAAHKAIKALKRKGAWRWDSDPRGRRAP